MKYILFSVYLISHILSGQQNIDNSAYFSGFFTKNRGEKKLLLLGENHSSSAASTIYPELVELLHEKDQLRTLLIEFGPSEAYFYNRYLESGDKKYLAYTIYGGFYTDWKKAWEKLYLFNKTLKKPLKVVGVDFDRTRTFGYALYNIFKTCENRPAEIDSLMNVIRQPEFYKTYTIGYPTDEGKEFVKKTKDILSRHMEFMRSALPAEDMEVVSELMGNHAVEFGGSREEDIGKNITDRIKASGEKNFLMLVGRDHTYLKPVYNNEKIRLAELLKKESSFSTLTGLILHEESQQWDEKYKNPITLYEVRDKIPWKEFSQAINKKAKQDFTVIPLTGTLEPLSEYTDYILIARNQGPIQF
ncbi:TraB/GumN family protein [Sinomicrobium soli]|uniref:hypothetical protein n=1 Tax=Sinomicrobium sp. N-1-3-6 TaxID=2219864 RepID=UPI000DCC2CF1|nr:hypothetical protein [Sinomicrobium sp. N-1-3-6]RAV29078.1 hypothetical protein DN748_09130 [Sinomicrobium sp. N-1-3-6]